MYEKNWRKLAFTGIISSFTLSFTTFNPLSAQAVGLKLDATVTADNHYGLYVGNNNGSKLVFIGRNEKGPFHIADTSPPVPDEACPQGEQPPFNWTCPEAFSKSNISPNVIYNDGTRFLVDIYAVVWDDEAVDSALLGEFELTGCDCDENELFSTAFLTDSTWEYIFTDIPNPGTFGNVPPLGMIKSEIASASWLPVNTLGPNDGTTLPWKRIPSIDSSAQFLDALTFGDENAYIFRKTVEVVDIPACVPEPSTVLSMAAIAGLGIFPFSRKTKKRK